MRKLNKVLTVVALAVFGLAFFIGTTKAQTPPKNGTPKAAPVAAPSDPAAAPEALPGTVNCFDYYKFGSVQVDVESEIGNTVSGVPMTFRGTIKNDNDYPVVDGQVYVKVFRKQTNQNLSHANGFYLVDQFFAAENVNLNAKENKVITFDWKVPNYALPGEYQIATFFTSAKKFNLLGLSFTDDVVGNAFSFAVKGENKSTVEFNKNAVKVNDKDYHFAAFPPKIDNGQEINIQADLVNSTKTAQVVPVTWTLYSWDGLQAEKKIDTKTENVQLNPNEIKNLHYVIQDKNYPVYFLVAEAQYKDTKSILDVRTGRSDINRTRINFPAVLKYPLKANEQNTLFVCAHNSGTADIVDNNKLIITLLDENQKEIQQYVYEGKISGAMMGLKEEFMPKASYESFYIKSELYTDGKLVDSATMKYDCPQLTPGKCKGKGLATQAESAPQKEKTWLSLPTLIGTIFLLIAILAIVLYRKKHNSQIGMFLLILLFGVVMFAGSGKGAEAKSVVWNGIVSSNFFYYWNNGNDVSSPTCHTSKGGFQPFIVGGDNCNVCSKSNSDGWCLGLQDPNITITYNAQIINVDTGSAISDGANISVGTKIRLEKVAHQDTDISWFGTGHSADSPYGVFLTNAASPTQKCDSKFFVNRDLIYDTYIPFSVNQPGISFSHSGTAGLSCDGTGALCTINSAGTIAANINFASTYGKFYYRYSGGVCYSNSVPMELINSSSAYQLTVPAQAITYNLTAVVAGNPPTAPVVTGTTTGATDTAYSFSAASTDPDAGDTVRYGFDWNKDGVVDQWAPAASTAPVYVASGTSQSASYTWTTTGAKTFQVLAQDQTGNSSAWTPFTITLSTPANCPADCTSWSGWGGCSDACGGGTQQQTCTSVICNGSIAQQACNTQACPTNNYWKEVAP